MAIKTIDPDDVEAEELLGSAIERREDPALVSGDAEYTDDIQRPQMAHLSIIRSQHAHARIESIDASEAEAMEGVVDIYTHDDLAADHTPGDLPFLIPVGWLLPDLEAVDYPMLAREKVRYQGQPIAIVVAENRYTADEAAEQVRVEYERLDAVIDPAEAVSGDGPDIHPDVEDNVAFDWEIGDAEKTDAAFEDADATVEIDLVNQRLIPNAIEPRATVAEYNQSTNDLTVHMTSQNPHLHRLLMAGVIDHPEHKLRVRAPDVGGGFGSKIHHYPDEALTAWCAKHLGRPVKWQATRSETYLTDAHGRDHDTQAELALDEDGRIQGLRVDTTAGLGAYLSTFSPSVPTYLYGTLLSGQYDIPAIHCSVTGAFTNGTPVDAYRGAGRPEAAFVVERLMYLAAKELGMDPAEFRRRNFVDPDDFPYETQVAVVYDSGDYEKPLDAALEAVDYEALREEQAAAREDGRYIGIGLSSYIEACGLAPSELAGQLGAQAGLWESGTVRFTPSGTVRAYSGSSGHGQGHDTTFAQVLVDELGVPYDDIEIIEGDTDEIQQGMGTYGSRSAAVGASALVESAEKVVEKARAIAAHQLEASEEDIVFEDGEFSVEGAPDRSMDIQELAGAAYLAHNIPDDMEPGLEATTFYDPENFTFPFGTHVAVVEVDPDSGEIDLRRYVAVDDVGNQINPKIVEGQVHGGIVQGIGQAMYEGARYDENGQLLTGTMQDYAVPKALHAPEMEVESTVTECPHNPLGVKGVGEAGTIASPQAVVNAVCDALEPHGVDHIDMPLTDEAVWQAIHNGHGGDA
ncbi:MAG: xanthine dehydrogenase family protein molybdopterin-binding subunit [Halobacteriales archaeon]